ncbi:MAG: AI-2E family transporter [Clostridia bacterium]|nr:AI-2E family transporter [Clostridia bacterium]
MEPEKKKKLLTLGISCAIIFTILYLITNFTAITAFFGSIFTVLTPIIVGAAIAYLLNPILKLFEYKIFKNLKSKGVRRALSLILTYVVAALAITGFFLLIIPSVIQSVLDLTSKFDTYVNSVTGMIDGVVNKISKIPELGEHIDKDAIINGATKFFFASGDIFSTIMDYTADFALGLYVGVKNTVLGIFISIYILIDKERLHAMVRKLTAALFKDKGRNRILKYARMANRTFGGFLIGKIVDSVIIGLLTFVVLVIFRIPYAPLVSTIVGITNIIPIFGPIFGAIPSAFIIFIASPQKALIFLVLILLIQQLDGNVIGPKILGNSTGISSLGVIVAIIIMGEYFGVVGMIVGVPLFAMIIMLVNEFAENKLKSKGLPTSTDDYYPAYSLVDPHEHHEKIGERIFKSLFGGFGNVIKKFRDKHKKEKEQEQEKESEANNERTDK